MDYLIWESFMGNLLGNGKTNKARMKQRAPIKGGPNHQAPIHLGSDSPKLGFSVGLTYKLELIKLIQMQFNLEKII